MLQHFFSGLGRQCTMYGNVSVVAILVHIAKCAADTTGHISVVFVDLGILALGGRGGESLGKSL